MEAFAAVFSAFGLAASAGLNAYIPLFIVGLMARYTDWLSLSSPWDLLSNPWVLGLLFILILVEFFADKFPAINHANDIVQTFVRPVAGAILFAGSTQVVTELNPIVGMIAGILVAGSVHATKAVLARPAVTATTGGAGNVPVSIAEDIIATVLSIFAIVLPVLIATTMIIFTAFVIWLLWRRSNAARAASRIDGGGA